MSTSYRKIGVIREGKKPEDRRLPLTPAQFKEVMQRFPDVDLVVQRSNVRSYTDAEYEAFEIPLVEDLTDRDLLIGVKEVPVELLIANKAYQFFSHTIKQQPHNSKRSESPEREACLARSKCGRSQEGRGTAGRRGNGTSFDSARTGQRFRSRHGQGAHDSACASVVISGSGCAKHFPGRGGTNWRFGFAARPAPATGRSGGRF